MICFDMYKKLSGKNTNYKFQKSSSSSKSIFKNDFIV
jgi:hypothetical protein